jgi:hypothetical protein
MQTVDRACRRLWHRFRSRQREADLPKFDPDIQRIIDAAQPGILDVLAAYERFESPYMAAARVRQENVVITSGASSAPPSA